MADLDISIYESVGVAESISQGDMPVSLYDSISVTDVVTIQPGLYFYTDPRSARNPRIPVHSIEAEFAQAFNSTDRNNHPLRSIESYAGSELDKTAPTYELEATLVPDSYTFTLNKKIPTYGVVADTGWMLISKSPSYGIDSQFLQELAAWLSRSLPGWKIEATMYSALSFELDRVMPTRYGDFNLSFETEAPMSLDESIPPRTFAGAIYEQGGFTLDKKIPVRSIETESYVGAFELDVSIPAWIVEAISDTIVYEPDRFEDYILRYVRP